MRKLVLIPDSFKGTMASWEICDILEGVVKSLDPACQVVKLPVADGGEGSVDAFLRAMGGRRVELCVKGPYFQEVPAFYGLVDGGRTAVVEMAACAGLPLVGEDKRPDQTTTYGVGQLIAHAISQGARRVVLGLGGSATNDMGCGMAAALGVRFLDETGASFIPVGGNLSRIRRVELDGRLASLAQVELVAMCDIDNPLYGPRGAAHVFAPQKGADEALVRRLDEQLRLGSSAVERCLGQRLADAPGAGAAGGMGFGAAAFLGFRLQMGIETVLETVGFASQLQGADLVITGEGKLDSQSLRGKVVFGVAKAAKAAGVPVVALVGDIEDPIDAMYGQGLTAALSINRVAVPYSKAKLRAREDLARTMESLLRLLALGGL